MAPAFAASDMQGMDHSQMGDMQSMDDGMMQPAAPSESRTPIPALTDADRAAVFTSHAGHQVHDSAINTYFLADKLEWQDADHDSICRVFVVASVDGSGLRRQRHAGHGSQPDG